MKKVLSIIAALMLLEVFAPQAWAIYDFTATAPTGQTLRFKIIYGTNVEVVDSYDAMGALFIPSTVNNEGTTYTVTRIGERAFHAHSFITSVSIPNTVERIEDEAFYCADYLTDITIPSSVTYIGENVFFGCSSLSNITIPNSITTIGYGAFMHCTSLTSITIPSSVINMGESLFYGCSSLSSVTINCAKVAEYTFSDCTNLSSVTFGNAVRRICESAFQDCTGLTTITFPSLLNTIEDHAFSGCSGLGSVTIPQSVANWGEYVFWNCEGLVTATINSPSVGASAFQNCTGLTSIVIGSSVTSIGNYAFLGCSNLISATSDAINPPILGSFAFQGIASNAHLTVPQGSVAAYQSSSWNNYFSISTPVDCTISTFPWTEGFEGNVGECWIIEDSDGDGNNWFLSEGHSHSGSVSIFSASYDNDAGPLTPDNWLISPPISLPAGSPAQLSWYARGLDASDFAEYYSVYVSSSGNEPGNFSTSLYSGTTTSAWVKQTVNLSSFAGQTVYIAFRHYNCTNMFYLGIDDINITTSSVQGIDGISDDNLNIYSLAGQIVVKAKTQEEVDIYNMIGRRVDGGRKSHFDVPNSGVYIVKIGDYPARKVVVIR